MPQKISATIQPNLIWIQIGAGTKWWSELYPDRSMSVVGASNSHSPLN
jgi:hypothetical protein